MELNHLSPRYECGASPAMLTELIGIRRLYQTCSHHRQQNTARHPRSRLPHCLQFMLELYMEPHVGLAPTLATYKAATPLSVFVGRKVPPSPCAHAGIGKARRILQLEPDAGAFTGLSAGSICILTCWCLTDELHVAPHLYQRCVPLAELERQ